MPSNSFFTSSTIREKNPSAWNISTLRCILYPSCIALGEAALHITSQSMILASVPALSSLLLLSAISACLLTPIFFSAKLLIDQNASHNPLIHHLSAGLLYALDMFLHVQCIAKLAFMMHKPVMNAYTLYSILGFGVLPSVLLCLFAVVMIQAYSHCTRQPELSSEHVTFNQTHEENFHP